MVRSVRHPWCRVRPYFDWDRPSVASSTPRRMQSRFAMVGRLVAKFCDMGLCYETGQKLPVAPQGTGCEVRAGLEADLSLMPSL
jgi:hypothetical protein